MQGSRERGAAERCESVLRMEEFDVQIRLQGGEMIGTDHAQIPERSVIAPHHEMLAVVHLIARLFVDKRVRSAAEVGFLFEKENVAAF